MVRDEEFSRLFRQYAPLIFVRCRRILGSDELAEEATQETFLRVFKHLAHARSEDETRVWIIRTATNYALNLREYEALRTETRLPAQDAVRHLDTLLADRDFTRRLIAAAPAKLRAPAWLHLVEGFRQDEVATLLGKSRRTIASRLQAFEAFARRFAERADR